MFTDHLYLLLLRVIRDAVAASIQTFAWTADYKNIRYLSGPSQV